MLKRRVAILACSLAIASTLVPVSKAFGEDLTVETNKVYTPGTNNGVSGYWVEFTRKHYTRNQNFISDPVGRYDSTIQDAFVQALGLNRALSASERQALYSKYGIPTASSAAYDANAYHNFDWNGTLARIKADLAAGQYNYLQNAASSDVQTLNKLLNAGDSASLVDALGPTQLNAYIQEAFADNSAASGGQGDGGDYIYYGGSGHTLSYAHGINFENPAQINQAVLNADGNRSVQDILLNSPNDFKQLTGMSNVDAVAQAARLTAIADMIDKGLNPVGLKIDSLVNTTNGPAHLLEGQPTAARLRDLSRWLIASTWTTHSPIALDLNHDGKIGVTGTSTAQKRLHKNKFVANGSVWFDILANGKKQHIEWLNNDGDGFLVDDTSGRVTKAAMGSGEITAMSLFGDAIGYTNGFHKLAYKATKINIASVLNPTDSTRWSTLFHKKPVMKGAALNTLKVWIDKNHDAVVQPNELFSLASLGITEVGTQPTIRKNADGEYVIQSYFVQHGKKYMTEDVWFAEDPATQAKL